MNLSFLLAISLILILIVLIFIVYLFRSSEKITDASGTPEPFRMGEGNAPASASKPPPPSDYSASDLKKAFAKADKWLKTHVSGRDFAYRVPRFLMIGESGSGKTTTLRQSRLRCLENIPLVEEVEQEKQPCNFWFFERGLVLDVAGDLVLRRTEEKTADEKMWRLLLRQLLKYRPQRPADGIILSINCSDLLMPESENRDHFNARIAQKAEFLYAKLWDAQKFLGMRFPVYLMVTGCESIGGFAEFREELPPRIREDMFGWSVPYSADTAYSSEWISEAFRHIESVLAQTRLELFAQGTRKENRDGLFMFSGNFEPLSDPLRVLSDHLFRQSAYHETFILRGIYFCGKGAFAKDLFERKIFPEHSLARPLRLALISRNRKVIAAQVAAALFTIVAGTGLWFDTRLLRVERDNLIQFLNKLDIALTDSKAKGFAGSRDADYYKALRSDDKAFFSLATESLAANIGDVNKISKKFIPASWFSGIHEKIEKSLMTAFGEVIIKGLFIDLKEKLTISAYEVLKPPTPDMSYEHIPLEQTPEFIALRQFETGFGEIEANAEIYNRLNTYDDMKYPGKLIESIYKIKLTASFYDDYDYCLNALKKTNFRHLTMSKYKSIALNKVTLKPLINRLFENNILLHQLKTLSLQMESFGQKSRSVSTDDEKVIRDLAEMISETEELLEGTSDNWIFGEKPDLGKSFDDLLFNIEHSKLCGPEVRRKLDSELQTAFRSLRDDLRSQTSVLTGPLLKREGGNITKMLSPAVLRLKSDLKRLLDQKFMVLEKSPETDIAFDSGMRLIWDTDMLEDAIKLFEPYEDFINSGSGLKHFPNEMRNAVSNVARRNVELNLMDRVAKATQSKPVARGASGEQQEADMRSEIRNFKEASKYLGSLLTYSEKLDLTGSHQMLSEITFRQAGRLLNSVDGLLEKEEPYRSKGKDFSWWDGKDRLSLAAFGVTDQKELEYYLSAQRERVRYLAYEYAEPMISFFLAHKLLKNRKEEQLMFKWERILSELEKYETRQPDNSVAILEKFILSDLDSAKPENCLFKIKTYNSPLDGGKGMWQQHSSDPFIQKRNDLMAKLHHRCQKIATENAIAKYAEIRTFFDAKLSGRFPFLIVANQQAEAKPEDIRDFYRIFDKTAPDLMNMLKISEDFGNSGEYALAFLTRMTEVRKMFAAYIEKDKKDAKEDKKDSKQPADDNSPLEGGKGGVSAPDIPIFDLDTEFRVNRQHEQMANRIIEWRLNVGGQSVRNGESLRTGQWRFGDPIILTLRWAKDGNDYPVFGGSDSVTNQDEKTVTYEFDNQWSLLRFLRLHAGDIEDFGQPTDPKPHTLKFAVATQKEGMEGEEKGKFATKAYIRIVLMTPGKTKTVLTMPYFPEIAPELKIGKPN